MIGLFFVHHIWTLEIGCRDACTKGSIGRINKSLSRSKSKKNSIDEVLLTMHS